MRWGEERWLSFDGEWKGMGFACDGKGEVLKDDDIVWEMGYLRCRIFVDDSTLHAEIGFI
jgi:hypothetical protein